MAEEEMRKICVNCEQYVPYGSEVEGRCRATAGDKPGQLGTKVRFDTDASQCSNFEQLAYVHTDFSQIITLRSRMLGGHEDVKTDRLVYEKHDREEQ